MSTPDLPGFTAHDLGEGLWFLTGALPAELVWDAARFDEVWALHPEGKHVIHMPGGPVETPRWQQAYGADYRYTGRINTAPPGSARSRTPSRVVTTRDRPAAQLAITQLVRGSRPLHRPAPRRHPRYDRTAPRS